MSICRAAAAPEYLCRFLRPLPLILPIVACGTSRDPSDLCADRDDPVHALCVVRRASESGGDDAQATAARCDEIADETWRSECHFQLAEALARAGRFREALSRCEDGGRFARMCFGHAFWVASDGLVPATPADADAQARVDAFAAGLPPLPEGRFEGGVEAIARAAAWHGIYAGSGSAERTAALGASAADAPFARGAFAWEVVRLLGPGTDARAALDAARGTWRGDREPLRGEGAPEPTWTVRLAPRRDLETVGRLPSVRTYPGGTRFVAPEADADLTIAVIEAAWSFGTEIPDGVLLDLLAHPSEAVAATAARHVGLGTGGLTPDAAPPGFLRTLAEGSATAARMGTVPRSVVASPAPDRR